ncbi:hypothetical protein [Methanocaldococcus sp.]
MKFIKILRICVLFLFGILGVSIINDVGGVYKYLLILIFIPSILHILLLTNTFKKLENFLNYYCLSTFILVLILLAINNIQYFQKAILLFALPILLLLPSIRRSPKLFTKIFISTTSLWITIIYFRNIGNIAVLLSILSFILVYLALNWNKIKKVVNVSILKDLEPSGIFVLGAIFCLLVSAICLIKNNEYLANKIAEYAYFLLVVGVLRALYEYVRDIKENEDDKHEIY